VLHAFLSFIAVRWARRDRIALPAAIGLASATLWLPAPLHARALSSAETPQLAQAAPDDYFDRAYYYFEQGSLRSAISYYTRVLSLDPSYAEAYNNRGNAHADLGDYADAIADFTAALNYDHPELGLIYYNRGNTYLEMGRYDEAIADFSAAIGQDDGRTTLAYYNRGNANLALRRYHSAIEDFSQAIARDAGYVEAYNNRGSTQFYLENYTDALADYTAAIDLEYTSDRPSITLRQAHYNRGNIYYHLGDYRRALADYTDALAVEVPDSIANGRQSADTFYRRALARMFLGDRVEALADLERAIELYDRAGSVEWFQNAQTLRDRWQ